MNIQYRKREKAPKKAKKRIRKLVNQLYNTKYFWSSMMKNTFVLHMAGNSEILHKYKKLLMWIAVSDPGMSEPFFRTFKAVTINTSIYINKCLEKRLLPFIHKYHGDCNYLFWPYLASSHYSKDSLNWMDESIMSIRNPTHQMNFKHDRQRTFEDIWLKRFTKENGKKVLIDRIKLKLKEINQSLMKGV